MSATRNILVFGATGKQGSALVRYLSAANTYHILAVSRDPSSPAAQALAQLPNTEVLQGDVGHTTKLFDQPVYGVFFYTMELDLDLQIKEAKELLDKCVEKGVKHVVFTTADLFGSGEKGTGVPFLDAKVTIENYLISLSSLQHTIIRPLAFMENLYWDLYRAGIPTMWTPDRTYKFIAADDIGRVAAQVFEEPEKWVGKTFALAGDGLKKDEISKVFEEVTGEKLDAKEKPVFPKFIAGAMEYFAVHESDADVQWNRETFPFLKDLKTWLQSSGLAAANK
ncbi:hypothetical protein IAT38_003416 [Cryptococcus sp. DSM 104549]